MKQCGKCKRWSYKITRTLCPACYAYARNHGLIEVKKAPHVLTSEQEEIIVGLLLGDGCLHTGGKFGKNSRLTVIRKTEDKDYLHWQFDKLIDFYKSGPGDYSTYDKRTNKIYRSSFLNSMVSPCFSKLREKWYPAGIKIVPTDVTLTPLTVAIWLCDDGTIRKNHAYGSSLAVKFATHGFTHDEVKFLAGLLHERYDEYFGVYNSKDGYLIKAATNAALKISNEVRGLIPACMSRKVYETFDSNRS